MSTTVQGPDGQTFQFPDGVDEATMAKAMQAHYGAPKTQQRTFVGDMGDAINKANYDIATGSGMPGQVKGALDLVNGTIQATGGFAGRQMAGAGVQSRDQPHIVPRADHKGYEWFMESNPTVRHPVQYKDSLFGKVIDQGQFNIPMSAAANVASQEKTGEDMVNLATFAIGGGEGKVAKAAGEGVDLAKKVAGISPDVQLLRQRGVQLTPGMAKGGVTKQIEDIGQKMPIIGPKIAAARQSSVGTFNKAVLNDALQHIGETLPEDMAAGHESNAHAYETVQKAYERTRPSQPIMLPEGYGSSESLAEHPDFDILANDSKGTVARIIKNRVLAKATDGALDGDNYTRAVSGLRKDIKRYGASPDPENQLISQILKDHLEQLHEGAAVQDPAFAAQKDALDTAYAKIKTAQKASQSVAADDGIFTPAQYHNAVKSADASVGKNRFSTGQAFNQDFSQAAKNVLSDKVANTGGSVGVAGHLLTGAVGAFGHIPGLAVGAAGLKGASMAYEPAAIARLNAELDAQIAAQLKALNTTRKAAGKGPISLAHYKANLRLLAATHTATAGSGARLPLPAPAQAAAQDQQQ